MPDASEPQKSAVTLPGTVEKYSGEYRCGRAGSDFS
jgi:hypothetical protein